MCELNKNMLKTEISKISVFIKEEKIKNKIYLFFKCKCGYIYKIRSDSKSLKLKCNNCIKNETLNKINKSENDIINECNKHGIKFINKELKEVRNTKYGNRYNLVFECTCKNIYKIRSDRLDCITIKCIDCRNNKLKTENKCREIIESITGYKFNKIRLNMFGRILELDGYNEELKIAFEYNGEFHYKEIEKYFNNLNVDDQIERDNLKVKYCKENDIKLIVIPYFEKDKYNLIKNKLNK